MAFKCMSKITVTYVENREILGSHSGVAKNSSILWCDIVSTVNLKCRERQRCPITSWRLRRRIECWDSNLTLILGTNRTAELSAPRAGFTPKEIPWYSFLLRGWVDPRASECRQKEYVTSRVLVCFICRVSLHPGDWRRYHTSKR